MRVYQEFVQDLNRSQTAVLAVAKFLQAKEHWVLLPPHRVTPDEKQRYSFTDDCDLVFFTSDGPSLKAQVKWSSREFSSPEEFGFQMVTVDEDYKIESQDEKPPVAYFIVNRDCSGAILIPWSTRDQWDVFAKEDPRQGGRVCTYYRCPLTLCQWRDLPPLDVSEPLSMQV